MDIMPPKKVYTCTVCGKEGFWNDDWSYYGSIALAEDCPKDLIFCCSKTCQQQATQKINNHKWLMPEIDRCGAVISERRGY
jgi:hypothetical protein